MLAIPATTVRYCSAAYDACRTGGLEDQYQTLGSIGAGMDYAVSRSFCTREALEQVALGVALNTSHLPVDAKPVGFDAETQLFVFGDTTDGQTLDREALCDDVEAALAQGGGEVELKFTYTEAEVPVDGYGLIATYTTDASTSSSARIHNIRLAHVGDQRHLPATGRDVLLQRRGGRAHQGSRLSPRARLFAAMQTVMEYGGGICQVSSTLYAAVRKAGLEIVERYPPLSVRLLYPQGHGRHGGLGQQGFQVRQQSQRAHLYRLLCGWF